RRLTRLDLSQNMIHSLGRLASWPALASVGELNLRINTFEKEGAAALARSRYLGSLKVLQMGNCFIGNEGAAALARCPGLAGLVELELYYCQIGDEGARALADSPHLGGIERLNLGLNQRIGAAGRAALRARFGERVVL